MPKFRPVQQQTVVSAPTISADAFGAAAGQGVKQLGSAVSGVGDALMDLELRTRERADVIDRVRQQNAFDESAIALRQNTLDTDDITSPQAVERFRENLNKQRDSILAAHNGTPASKARLRATLENQQGQYVKQIMGDQIQAQQTLMLDTVQAKANQLASVTASAPDALEDSMAEIDQFIDEMSPALSGAQEQEYRRSSKEGVLLGAISNYLEKGDHESASMLMNSPEYSQILSPAATRRARIDTVKVKAERQAAEQAHNDRVAQYTMLTGRNLTPEEIATIRLMPDKPSEMTAADKIAEYEVVTGQPASQAVVDKIYGVTDKGRFGTGLRGKMLELINDGYAAYSSGTMSADDAVAFQSAVNEVYGVKEHTDPVTGVRSQSQPSMPRFVKEALNAGTNFYGQVDVGGLANEGAGGSVELDEFEGDTLWDMADEVSGPITGAERLAFETTGIGDPIQQKAAFVARNLREGIVAGIRPEGRIANQYRQELMELVDIQPKLMQNDIAYRYKLADIDTELRARLNELDAISMGDKSGSTVNERRDATVLANNIRKAIVRLNVQRPSTPDEARALPAGTYFIDPSGKLGRVPEKDKSTGGRSGR